MNKDWIESALRAGPPDEPRYVGGINERLSARASEKVREDEPGVVAVLTDTPRRRRPMNVVLAAAAAVLVVALVAAVVAREQPHTSATPPTTLISFGNSPAELVGRWVGPTPEAVSTPNPSAPAFVVFGNDRVALEYFAGGIVSDFSSQVDVMAEGHLRLVLTDQVGRCLTGAVGEYRWSLSPQATNLEVEAISDECATRAAALTGTWTHTACPVRGSDCLGPLEAGRYASVSFDPFNSDVYGEVLYDVSDGWSSTLDDKSRLTLLPPEGAESGVHGLYLFADVAATAADCTTTHAAADGAPAIAAVLASVPGLAVSASTSTVGGYPAQILDISMTESLACGGDVPLLTSRPDESIAWTLAISDGQQMQVLLIELPESRTMAIVIASDRSDAEYAQLLVAANDVINSFEFSATP